MASSYTTSFGIEKIGSGEQSGAWGTTTNHNLDILDRIASYKAVGLTGTTTTFTVREASPGSGTENLQDGMYRVVKFTGALGGNNTVTVAPNTTAAYFIMINATTDSGSSGPYSVILTQGSGANITIENGKSALVYMDGAGSGAAVVDALSNLALATITASGDITSSGTFNALGDTAASDKAAVGYTSAEGLILTGQGSTNDVTIKNDADADVLEIPTGGTDVTVVGDITAGGTVGATGDTAAGDDAALGYTSAEGLILTGQGSTNDVTIKNDADADVITIATGATNVDIVGDVTAGTVNADGDTAAGDNATMGYTAAEGLILTGQGSTNDVTIKNDADTAVIKIATGATGVEIVGALTLGTDLSVANGGTGASTFTANNVLLGNGTSAFQVIAPGADGQVLTSTGSTWQSEALSGGKILQVVQATKTDTFTTTSTSFTDVTDVTVAITPAATSSKILVLLTGFVGNSSTGNANAFLSLVRGSTEIFIGDAASSRVRASTTIGPSRSANGIAYGVSIAYVDSPSSTSETTYKAQARIGGEGTMVVGRSGDDSDSDNEGRVPTSIIVMEIGA
tara:strand:+ start:399 stop:2111 length:1713 start_codon:yes stop_codon:yes gene_type:complete